jgi:hypothetical protein
MQRIIGGAIVNDDYFRQPFDWSDRFKYGSNIVLFVPGWYYHANLTHGVLFLQS